MTRRIPSCNVPEAPLIKTKTTFTINTNPMEFRNRNPKDREHLERGMYWLDS